MLSYDVHNEIKINPTPTSALPFQKDYNHPSSNQILFSHQWQYSKEKVVLLFNDNVHIVLQQRGDKRDFFIIRKDQTDYALVTIK